MTSVLPPTNFVGPTHLAPSVFHRPGAVGSDWPAPRSPAGVHRDPPAGARRSGRRGTGAGRGPPRRGPAAVDAPRTTRRRCPVRSRRKTCRRGSLPCERAGRASSGESSAGESPMVIPSSIRESWQAWPARWEDATRSTITIGRSPRRPPGSPPVATESCRASGPRPACSPPRGSSAGRRPPGRPIGTRRPG